MAINPPETSRLGPQPDPSWRPTVRDVRNAVWSIQEQGEWLRLYLEREGEPREEDSLVHVLGAFLSGPLGQFSDYLHTLDEEEGDAYEDLGPGDPEWDPDAETAPDRTYNAYCAGLWPPRTRPFRSPAEDDYDDDPRSQPGPNR